MPLYTAQVGHWSDDLVDDLATELGLRAAHADRVALKVALNNVAAEIELVAGRAFGISRQRTATIESGGLPFAEIPDLQVDSFDPGVEVWPVADPVHPLVATVLQLGRWDSLPERAIPVGEALWIAGHIVAKAKRDGFLSREHLVRWLGTAFDPSERIEFLKRLVDATNRIHVPIVAAQAHGWWFQLTRRLVWVTSETPEEQRLLEPLIDEDGGVRALAGAEPILIVARLTDHPVKWAFLARIWPGVTRPSERTWRILAKGIHGHGIPILTIDEASSAEETACQLLLLAYWHGYVSGDDAGLADALARAYPEAVQRISRATNAPNHRSAASMLLEGLLHPGFDPVRGADSTRRYVNKKARIAILEYRKADAPGVHPWDRHGVSERYYYKLVKRLASKDDSRYRVDDQVHDAIRAHLQDREGHTERRAAAMGLLLERGFSREAARKWLQRHPIEQALSARPRPPAQRV